MDGKQTCCGSGKYIEASARMLLDLDRAQHGIPVPTRVWGLGFRV